MTQIFKTEWIPYMDSKIIVRLKNKNVFRYEVQIEARWTKVSAQVCQDPTYLSNQEGGG